MSPQTLQQNAKTFTTGSVIRKHTSINFINI